MPKDRLWPIFAFTLANSLGSGVITNGIFFLTKSAYGFSDLENFLLGVVEGITYVAAAFFAGRLLRTLRNRFSHLSTRSVLCGLMLWMAIVTVIPLVARSLSHTPPGQLPAVWPIWLTVALYIPATGILWPLVESYVSGGRSGQQLRSVVGRWNVVWSGATILAFVGVSPLIEHHAAESIAGLGLAHAACLLLLLRFTNEPAPHLPEHHEPHPPVYTQLLVTFRRLLPLSYVVLCAMGPYLPSAAEKLGIEIKWQAALAATWLASRCATFFILEKWHGWQGSWAMPIVGGTLLLAGFGAVVMAPTLPAVGMALFVAGLASFGIGMATIYTAALYYAMEVGQSDVDAGGMHETLIGVGYTLGPAIGLAAAAAVKYAHMPAHWFNPAVLGVVAALGFAVAAIVLRDVYTKKPR